MGWSCRSWQAESWLPALEDKGTAPDPHRRPSVLAPLCPFIPVSLHPCLFIPVSFRPCVPSSLCPLIPVSLRPCVPSPLCPITPVSHHPCVPAPLCPFIPVLPEFPVPVPTGLRQPRGWSSGPDPSGAALFSAELPVAESVPCLLNALCHLRVAPRRFSHPLCNAVGLINVCGRGDFCIFLSLFHQTGFCVLGPKPASHSRSLGCSGLWCRAILSSLGSC